MRDLFDYVDEVVGTPDLVVHNIDGRTPDVFRKPITDVEPELVLETLKNSTFSAFLVGQQAAQRMLHRLRSGASGLESYLQTLVQQ